MKKDTKKKNIRIDASWTGYSYGEKEQDKEELEVRADKSFIEHVMRHKPIRIRVIAIFVIAFVILII